MLSKLSKYRLPINELIGSFLISLLIISQCFFGISEIAFGTTIIYKIVLALGSIVAFFLFNKKFSVKQFGLFFVICSYLFITFVAKNGPEFSDLALSFVIYGCVAFVYSFSPVNKKALCWICTLFGLLWLGLFLLQNHFKINDSFLFGHTLLPVAISNFLLLSTYKNDGIVLMVIKIVLFTFLAVLLVFKGSRGPVVCFLIFIFVHFLPCLKQPKVRIIYIVFLAIFILLLVFAEQLVTIVYNAMPGKIAFIDKTYALIKAHSDVSNNRFEIIAEVFKQYKFRDFIFGIGIGGYSKDHPENDYTHNLVISVLLDFGIIGVLFILFCLVVFIYLQFKNSDDRIYSELLFGTSFLPLLFSQNYWKLYTFWLFLFFIINSSDLFFVDIRKIGEKLTLKRRSEAC